MKKLFITLAMTVFMGLSALMTPVKAGGVYDGIAPGSSVLGVRLGLSDLVGANVTYDYSLARVWKGSFTIGGQVGYMWNGHIESYNGSRYSWNWNKIDFKLRTTYRFNVVVPAWEVYAGVGLGGGIALYNQKAYDKNLGSFPEHNRHNYGFFSGAFILGTSYYFSDAVGVNLEFDLGSWHQSWVNLGFNFKF